MFGLEQGKVISHGKPGERPEKYYLEGGYAAGPRAYYPGSGLEKGLGRMRPYLLGVDTGGTFTDFVLVGNGVLRVHKVLSTPEAPERAILQGVHELGLEDAAARGALTVVHGSTVATNAVLEGKGVRTAFVTNRGFADLLSIGRQTRSELYALQPAPEAPPVPAELCLETGGRLAADGSVLEPLTRDDIEALERALRRLRPQAVAINLLYSYLDARFEQALAAAVPEGVFVSCSSAVLPEYREYERGIATWLNAYVGPLMQGYLQRLRDGLGQARLSVMQSSGGTIAAQQAGEQAVHLLLSGPAGGLAGAAHLGKLAGRSRLLSFDMGGTSTDVALIDGAPRLTGEGRIGPYPVAVPMVDLHTIGAGGGSIAWVDAGGLLHVGPESAGADPGPACYGRGGTRATVTDANLVLGRIRPEAFLGGRLRLDVAAAETTVARVGASLGVGVQEAAAGIVHLANEHMARALRVISVQRGIDPRPLTLACFGGAGGLHVCALAEALGMRQAMVPAHAGVLSALGMLAAPRARQRSRTVHWPIEGAEAAAIERALGELAEQASAELVAEGIAPDALHTDSSLDLRYRGQSYTLNLPWQALDGAAASFHVAHEQRYGHRLNLPVEIVNLRVAVRGPAGSLPLQASPGQEGAAPGAGDPPLYRREALGPGTRIAGPALIAEALATTWLAAGWRAEVDEAGNLLLEQAASPTATAARA